MSLPPPPIQENMDTFVFKDWINSLYTYIGGAAGTIPWDQVSKAGSNLSDLAIKNHSSLTGVAGSNDGYHLSSTDYGTLSSGETATVVLSALSTAGAPGQLVFTGGILTSHTDPT